MENIQRATHSNEIREFLEEYRIDRAHLSGLAYYDYQMVRRTIKKGDALTLKREKDNRYDPFAVEVCFCGRKLGYWPAPDSKYIANLMDQGELVKARVLEKSDKREEVYEALMVEAYMALI